jgi:hypothetical protein
LKDIASSADVVLTTELTSHCDTSWLKAFALLNIPAIDVTWLRELVGYLNWVYNFVLDADSPSSID